MTRLRILAAALLLAAGLAVIPASSAGALGGCTRVDGSQWTSGHCTTTGGAPFMHAEQTCVVNWYTYVVQRGASVSVNGYSAAGPCSHPIVNRRLVQTTFP